VRVPILILVALISGSASAETFDRIPDLAQLVKNPIRGTYLLACSKNVDAAVLAGFEELRIPGGSIKLSGFSSFTLVVMINPGKPSDKIASNILIDLCIESDTNYTIVSKGSVTIPRTVDAGDTGWVLSGERSAIPQKTRPL